ncbi:unnamed protein product [Prunus armeniaca]
MGNRLLLGHILEFAVVASLLQKCAVLNHLLETEQVGGSVMDSIFGGGRHSTVAKSPSLPWCQLYSLLCPRTG